jgi:hypothetical protein
MHQFVIEGAKENLIIGLLTRSRLSLREHSTSGPQTLPWQVRAP